MSNVYMTGSKTKYATRKSKTFQKGRICVEEGCDQVLSQYNDRKQCFVHHKFKTPRVRGREDALEKYKDERK
jgi:hypothetical protein